MKRFSHVILEVLFWHKLNLQKMVRFLWLKTPQIFCFSHKFHIDPVVKLLRYLASLTKWRIPFRLQVPRLRVCSKVIWYVTSVLITKEFSLYSYSIFDFSNDDRTWILNLEVQNFAINIESRKWIWCNWRYSICTILYRTF